VLRDHRDLGEINRITLLQSIRAVRLALWDEAQQRLVSFREAKAQIGRAAQTA
jgi:omega-6 fatty acid desaturase (delta-12 desaturase)